MDNSDDSIKKAVTKRKLVDLKAVSNLAEEHGDDAAKNMGSQLKFKPNEELLQETSRIKNQRDLITKRLDKMNQAKSRVSKTVFEKVYRDYRLQLDGITKLLHEKKEVLARELESLYVLREKCVLEANRHKEILEEARFRHFLEEFSEEQYKEVESFETKEIERYQADLAQIQSFMRIHEELFDAQELKYPSKTEEPQLPELTPEPTKTVPQAPVQAPLAKQNTNHTRTVIRENVSDDYLDKTPIPSKNVERDDSIAQKILPEDLHNKSDDYFTSDLPAKPAAPQKEPENIFDVLEDMPMSADEVSETVSKVEAENTPLPPREQTSENSTLPASNFKLVFIEADGDLDISEFPMKDNVSIGRSPSNDLVLNAPKVSRQHAAINKYKDQYVIIDLKSSNGIFVNGRKVDEHTLNEGDEITVGGFKMIFKKS
ncbi:FHA domain-containing protein [bacterium]|nr:FHA domain-containing protein [bacterium]